jgi:hypothetical protein
MTHALEGTVTSLHSDGGHNFSKPSITEAVFLAGVGIEGDAHSGPTTQHLSRQKKDASRPNLRQVHLVASEIHEGLRAEGFEVPFGGFGENLTTKGIELGQLPVARTSSLRSLAFAIPVHRLTSFKRACAPRCRSSLRLARSCFATA